MEKRFQDCPGCGQPVDITRNLSGKISKEGDLSICKCGAYLVQLNNGLVRQLDSEELRRLKADDPMTYSLLEDRGTKYKDGML